jgi:hypothetical protein
LHIKQESGSAVSAISVNDCFSSTYKNYRIIFNGTTSTQLINARLRVSGTDETGSIYRYQVLSAEATATGASRSVNLTSWEAVITTIGMTSHNVIELSNPFDTTVTAGNVTRVETPNGNINYRVLNLGINSTASYTGLSLFVPSGTMTGTVDVYGYKLGS